MADAPTILIVDDEPTVLEVCRRSLEKADCRIATAATGQEALSLFQSGSYALVLTDLMMPGAVDGQELLKEIKSRSPDTDVIIMTGYPALETAIPTLKNGAVDYIQKPFNQKHLLSVVKRCFEKRRLSEDLDQKERLRQELKAAYSQLQDTDRLKEAFLARVNHELRIPLTPLFMALEQLQSLSTNAKSGVLCELIKDRLNRLQEVIEEVLLFSDLKCPEYECSKREVNARELLEKVIVRYYTLWEEKNLTVRVDWEPEAEMQRIDPALIETVYKNLFLNAIRFNQKNGEIHIQARRKRRHVEVSFADTGIGIPAGQMPSIFHSFYQVADYLTREVGGLGLGLAVVKRIAELHDGSVRVESRAEKGSIFSLILPIGHKTAAPNASPPIDMSILRDVTGDNLDGIRYLAEVYLRNTRHSFEKIAAAINAEDSESLRTAAHGSAGSSASFGAEPLSNLLRDLETMGKEAQMSKASVRLEECRQEFGRVASFLRQLLSQRRAA